MSLLLTLNRFHTLFSVSIADFKKVNATWNEIEITTGILVIMHWTGLRSVVVSSAVSGPSSLPIVISLKLCFFFRVLNVKVSVSFNL